MIGNGIADIGRIETQILCLERGILCCKKINIVGSKLLTYSILASCNFYTPLTGKAPMVIELVIITGARTFLYYILKHRKGTFPKSIKNTKQP